MDKAHIREFRAFNRFYTNILGLLDQHIYNSPYSLPEVRVLFELNHHDALTSKEIISLFSIDKGFLSRILRDFEKKKLIKKTWSKDDGRAAHISITDLGRREFKVLESAANNEISRILKSLTMEDCVALMQHMREIKTILSGRERKK
jgi:DNA-binding MarR family transcriptional regulator